MSVKILQNQARCLDCGDEPYSANRHDFKSCKCGNISVDGGLDYIRRVYDTDANMEDMSITIPLEAYKACDEALNFCASTGRNNLGVICAVARALRDNGVELVHGG